MFWCLYIFFTRFAHVCANVCADVFSYGSSFLVCACECMDDYHMAVSILTLAPFESACEVCVLV